MIPTRAKALLLSVLLALGIASATASVESSSGSASRLPNSEDIARLQRQFLEDVRPAERRAAASMLLLVGKGGPEHLEYLQKTVEQAPALDIPYPFVTRDQVGPKVSEDFKRWAAELRMTVDEALIVAAFDQPGAVRSLGHAHQEAAAPLLERALKARNHFVAVAAAEGLARLGCDARVVESIIAAASYAPADLALQFARPLLYCGLAPAETAVERLLRERVVTPGSAAERMLSDDSSTVEDLLEDLRVSVEEDRRAHEALLALRDVGD